MAEQTEQVTNLAEANREQLSALLAGGAPEAEPTVETQEDKPQETTAPATGNAAVVAEGAEPDDEVKAAGTVDDPEPYLDLDNAEHSEKLVRIGGQVHKAKDAIWGYKTTQVERQKLAAEKKEWEQSKANDETQRIIKEHARIAERLNDETPLLALDIAEHMEKQNPRYKGIVEATAQLWQSEYGIDLKDARIQSLEKRESTRQETEKQAKERQEQERKELEFKAQEQAIREHLNNVANKVVSDKEWERVKRFVPIVLADNPEAPNPITDAYKMAFPDAAKPARREPPKGSERPAGAAPKRPGLAGKSRSELAAMM